jgi:hypothetical protein
MTLPYPPARPLRKARGGVLRNFSALPAPSAARFRSRTRHRSSVAARDIMKSERRDRRPLQCSDEATVISRERRVPSLSRRRCKSSRRAGTPRFPFFDSSPALRPCVPLSLRPFYLFSCLPHSPGDTQALAARTRHEKLRTAAEKSAPPTGRAARRTRPRPSAGRSGENVSPWHADCLQSG